MNIEKKYLLTTHIDSLDLTDKRVLIRADLNIPINNGIISCDHKLKALLPTIAKIKKKGAKIVLITHMGRPTHKASELSTQNLIPWFVHNGYRTTFAKTIAQGRQKSFENKNTLLLIENLRFFPGERKKDELFAKELHQLGDYFINDAFGAIHNDDTSITLLPKLFPPDKRFIGPLIEKEITQLSKLSNNPAQPFVLILGGKKIKTKLPLIEHILEKTQKILLAPAISFTFSQYKGEKIGNSLVDATCLPFISTILTKAKQLEVQLVLPSDYLIAKGNFDGPTSYIDSQNIPNDFVGVSIGPKTMQIFAQEIMNAKTIFFNGAFGNIRKRETLDGMKAILLAMTRSKAFTVIGGGDSVYAAYLFGVDKQIDYLSTGGGATLAYLSGKQLPGLRVFNVYHSSKTKTQDKNQA